MAFLSISPPAGIYRNGTIYQAKGRWYDASLIRFQQDGIGPVGGWVVKSPNAFAFSGTGRAILAWRDNGGNRWIAVGTHTNLYVQNEAGENFDITPGGLSVGQPCAAPLKGFGAGFYGLENYSDLLVGSDLPASVWSLAAWGEDLAGCMDADGRIVLWTLDTHLPAATVQGAPANNQGIVVTDNGFLMALAAGGDGRKVAWCDQQNIGLWTPDATNQAGDYDLTTAGVIQCGRAAPGGALIFTDVDVWYAQYLGNTLVYGFERKGSGCGVISKGAVSARDSIAVWMGRGGFWLYDGQAVQPLDCDVTDHVFNRLNVAQESMVTAVHLADQGEVWWFYPDVSMDEQGNTNVENNCYVVWCYRESQRLGRNVWTIGGLSRLAGVGGGVYPTPLMVGADGLLYAHETGSDWGGAAPYLESGPFEIGQGDVMAEVQRIVPDQLADGDVCVTVFCRYWPNGLETTISPRSLTSPTDMLFQAREIRVRFTGVAASSWRIGTMRLDVVAGDPI